VRTTTTAQVKLDAVFAVADVTQGSIHAVIEIKAPPARVFAALTSPEQLASWWGSDSTYRTHDWKVDLRPGGAWSCRATNVGGGPVSTAEGEYRVIDPPKVLEYTWRPSWDGNHETVVRYELEPTATGTRVKVTHRGFGDRVESCKSHTAGWDNVLGWLREHVAT
jgi:uncharacterized protein YndB with AHSA1/START domain